LALDFVGSSDYFSNANPTVDQDADDITLHNWQELSTAEDGNTSSFGIGCNPTFRFHAHAPFSDGTYYWDRANLSGGRVTASYTGFYDKWTTIGLKSKYSATAQNAIWFDGVEQSTLATPDTDTTDVTGVDVGIWIANGGAFNGRMADFAIWKVWIGDNQIKALGRGVNPMFVSSTKPYLYYPMWNDEDPQPEWGGNSWTGAYNGTLPKFAGHPPIELLETYL